MLARTWQLANGIWSGRVGGADNVELLELLARVMSFSCVCAQEFLRPDSILFIFSFGAGETIRL